MKGQRLCLIWLSFNEGKLIWWEECSERNGLCTSNTSKEMCSTEVWRSTSLYKCSCPGWAKRNQSTFASGHSGSMHCRSPCAAWESCTISLPSVWQQKSENLVRRLMLITHYCFHKETGDRVQAKAKYLSAAAPFPQKRSFKRKQKSKYIWGYLQLFAFCPRWRDPRTDPGEVLPADKDWELLSCSMGTTSWLRCQSGIKMVNERIYTCRTETAKASTKQGSSLPPKNNHSMKQNPWPPKCPSKIPCNPKRAILPSESWLHWIWQKHVKMSESSKYIPQFVWMQGHLYLWKKTSELPA